MRIPVAVRRRIYRIAYWVLRAYWLVFRPPGLGVKCVLTHGGRVLLVEHTYGPTQWELPGGTIRRGEEPRLAGSREIEEELGVAIDSWRSLGSIPAPLHHRRDTLHCFQAELAAPALRLDRGEIERAEWFDPDDLPRPIGIYVPAIVALARRAEVGSPVPRASHAEPGVDGPEQAH